LSDNNGDFLPNLTDTLLPAMSGTLFERYGDLPMKTLLPTTFLVLFVLLFRPVAARGETSAAIGQSAAVHPAVTAFFESNDPFVEKVVIPNIEANRKSNVVLKVLDVDGGPLAGAAISAALKRHEFLFGHCDLATERDPRRRALLNEIFHYTCPGNVTKWRAYAKEPGKFDFSTIDSALYFCRERDIAFEWHFLSGYHPGWLETVTPDSEKARHQIEGARAVLKRYGDKVQFFQVINEDWLTHISRAKVYADQTAWFASLRKEFPGCRARSLRLLVLQPQGPLACCQ
jgi:hypothetical protein